MILKNLFSKRCFSIHVPFVINDSLTHNVFLSIHSQHPNDSLLNLCLFRLCYCRLTGLIFRNEMRSFPHNKPRWRRKNTVKNTEWESLLFNHYFHHFLSNNLILNCQITCFVQLSLCTSYYDYKTENASNPQIWWAQPAVLFADFSS